MKVKLIDVCENIFAGGDVPKNDFSPTKTDTHNIPIYTNGEKNNGLYGYTSKARVNEKSITVSARGTVGYAAIREKPFYPAIRLITLVPKNDMIYLNYLYYVMKNYKPNSGGTSIPQLTVPMLKNYKFPLPDLSFQKKVADRLAKIEQLISLKEKHLRLLDELVKSRFIEMFGDPIIKEKNIKLPQLSSVCRLKAGKFIKASDIYEYRKDNMYPCFGGNGLRGYVYDYTHEGNYPLIGRQGALCGNVKYAKGKFHATEHAIVVTPLTELDTMWLYYLLLQLNLNRYATGAAQPGLAVNKLEQIHIEIPSIASQKIFSSFALLIDKSKAKIQNSLAKLETLKKSLMQEYFA